MAAVLGVSAQYHDAAAALVVDGRVVAAVQEERLTRRKGDAAIPREAMRACLRLGGIEAGALDRVVFYEDPYAKLERVVTTTLRAFPSAIGLFPRAVGAQLGGKVWVLDALAEALDVPRARVVPSEHHLTHAASAFYPSPYARAAVVTVDGAGEELSTAIWRGDERGLTRLDEIALPDSLGLLYAALTAWLGFEVNDGEYKVMGLAAFGRPRFRDELARLMRLDGDGRFSLDMNYFAHEDDADLGFSPALERLLGPRRAPGRPWDLDGSEEDRRYADVAASLQAALEEALVALARRARALTGLDALCLAGGVALNCVAVSRVAREAGFARLFVQPAAGDAGGALGAALVGARDLGDPRPAPMTTTALGEAVDEGEAAELAAALGLRATPSGDPDGEIAARLVRGEVVGVVRGRFEFGPRALGQRSLLALPRDAATRERLNRVVKRREPFRPFAPAVAASAVERWFDGGPSDDLTPFMTSVRPVRADARARLAAVTHVDGTARVQTVADGGALAAILAAVERETGGPIVLNTSLNGNGEPIVGGAIDALGFLLAHAVDAVVIESLVVTK
jgi:carbamoyltransferase